MQKTEKKKIWIWQEAICSFSPFSFLLLSFFHFSWLFSALSYLRSLANMSSSLRFFFLILMSIFFFILCATILTTLDCFLFSMSGYFSFKYFVNIVFMLEKFNVPFARKRTSLKTSPPFLFPRGIADIVDKQIKAIITRMKHFIFILFLSWCCLCCSSIHFSWIWILDLL